MMWIHDIQLKNTATYTELVSRLKKGQSILISLFAWDFGNIQNFHQHIHILKEMNEK